jgi:hypothetical protein
MAEKTEKTEAQQQQEIEAFATRGSGLAPQCPPVGTNQTFWLTRRYHTRHQRYQTYHYHHAP